MNHHGQCVSELEKVCSTLEAIAKQFPSGSEEALAIRAAATAYIAVHQQKAMQKAYKKLLAAFDGSLSEKAKADLRRHGIEPDDFETDQSAE